MKAKLNILVLHSLGDPDNWRQSMLDHEFCVSKFAPEHNYIEHDFWLPLPDYFNQIIFDAIILTQTFLGERVDPDNHSKLNNDYGDLLRKNIYKIALPQDDYKCSAKLDRWFCEWNVNVVYTVCLNDWDVLYPNYIKKGSIKIGYTGYINNKIVEKTQSVLRQSDRKVDVAYRAANLSPAYGTYGKIKSEFGDKFFNCAKNLNLNLDISTCPKDTILGSRWYDFVENTRCMLGVNSGSSIHDPEGEIMDKVFRYLQRKPKASFSEVEEHCFPELDGQYSFSMISPRNIECALFGTVQILTPGHYGKFLDEHEHYIPLKPDMSNFSEVEPLIKNMSYLESMASRCREAILSYPELRYDFYVTEIVSLIKDNTECSDLDREKSINLIETYKRTMPVLAENFWRAKKIKTRIKKKIGDLGLRRIKYLLKDLFVTSKEVNK